MGQTSNFISNLINVCRCCFSRSFHQFLATNGGDFCRKLIYRPFMVLGHVRFQNRQQVVVNKLALSFPCNLFAPETCFLAMYFWVGRGMQILVWGWESFPEILFGLVGTFRYFPESEFRNKLNPKHLSHFLHPFHKWQANWCNDAHACPWWLNGLDFDGFRLGPSIYVERQKLSLPAYP